MKCIIGIAIVALLLQGVFCDDDYCDTDAQCDYDECCVKSRWGNWKVCKDKGDEPSDRCGGEYTCDCERGYTCVQDTSFTSKFRVGTGYCQRTVYG